MAIDYDKLARELLSKKGPPWPEYKHNHTSKKYKNYVYNISIDGHKFWQGRLDLFPFTWDNRKYFKTEDEAAEWVYKNIKKYLRRVKRLSKSYDNKTRRKHINWQIWLLYYQHHQHPKRICEITVF